MSLPRFEVRLALEPDLASIEELIAASVRGLQPQYTAAEREAAVATVFRVDSQLIADRTYFVAMAEGILAGCGGWSFRKTLYGGDHYGERETGVLDPAADAAKIRAIFVRPEFARRGLGTLLLCVAEEAAMASGFKRLEMGSTLAGLALYMVRGYQEAGRIAVSVGGGESIQVVRMIKTL